MNPHMTKPVGIRQANPDNLPVPGSYPPPQPPFYTAGPAGPFTPGGHHPPHFPGQPAPPASAPGGLFGNFNMEQLKQFIDRLGGIDGVLNTLSKVQRMVQSIQQIAPMLKLLIPKSGAKTAVEEEEDGEYVRPKRCRRKGSRNPRPRAGGAAKRVPRLYGANRLPTGVRRRSGRNRAGGTGRR